MKAKFLQDGAAHRAGIDRETFYRQPISQIAGAVVPLEGPVTEVVDHPDKVRQDFPADTGILHVDSLFAVINGS